ncbi:MAG: hypothetical protein IV100_24480 [Myxococcales bacterium]|nr:hypothetical protein [Myxococcales bacterium]
MGQELLSERAYSRDPRELANVVHVFNPQIDQNRWKRAGRFGVRNQSEKLLLCRPDVLCPAKVQLFMKGRIRTSKLAPHQYDRA